MQSCNKEITRFALRMQPGSWSKILRIAVISLGLLQDHEFAEFVHSRTLGVGVTGVTMGRTGGRGVSPADVSMWPKHKGSGGDQCKRAFGVGSGRALPTCHRMWAFILCRIFVKGGFYFMTRVVAVCRLGKKSHSAEKEGFPFVFGGHQGGISRSQSTERRQNNRKIVGIKIKSQKPVKQTWKEYDLEQAFMRQGYQVKSGCPVKFEFQVNNEVFFFFQCPYVP